MRHAKPAHNVLPNPASGALEHPHPGTVIAPGLKTFTLLVGVFVGEPAAYAAHDCSFGMWHHGQHFAVPASHTSDTLWATIWIEWERSCWLEVRVVNVSNRSEIFMSERSCLRSIQCFVFWGQGRSGGETCSTFAVCSSDRH